MPPTGNPQALAAQRPSLAETMQAAHAVLLDFDGPVCALFAHYPILNVAIHMRDYLAEHLGELPSAITQAAPRGPYRILAALPDTAPQMIPTINTWLTCC